MPHASNVLLAAAAVASLLSAPALSQDCIGSPDDKCPVWPKQFSAPFGLHASVPPIANASSMFYYKFLENGTQATVVDYQEHCFPFVNVRSAFESKPCKLYFVGQSFGLGIGGRGGGERERERERARKRSNQ